MAECGDGSAEVVGLQACGLGPLQDELQQLGFLEDAQNQFAIADVVDGQGGFVLLIPALDLGHLVVSVAYGLALAQ
ncbi:hypothetical protein D3C78_1583720 [compost metagenome]